jgi:uncharacterized DUF497 family protein
MEFEWDETKRDSNLAKHGVDFPLAEMLFDGRPVITAPSLRAAEKRYLTTGRDRRPVFHRGLDVARRCSSPDFSEESTP